MRGEETRKIEGIPLDNMSEGRGKKFLILKYFLMSSNAFGSMIGIFLVLFGISYPREKFPGGYRGQETAAIAGGFIFFSLIGYCGVSCSVKISPPFTSTVLTARSIWKFHSDFPFILEDVARLKIIFLPLPSVLS